MKTLLRYVNTNSPFDIKPKMGVWMVHMLRIVMKLFALDFLLPAKVLLTMSTIHLFKVGNCIMSVLKLQFMKFLETLLFFFLSLQFLLE